MEEIEFAVQKVASKEVKSGRLTALDEIKTKDFQEFLRRISQINDRHQAPHEPIEKSVSQIFRIIDRRHTRKQTCKMIPTLVSIQLGQPKTYGDPNAKSSEDKLWTTAIFKEPTSGPVRVTSLGLHGDGQADRKHHGGIDKAVLAYSFDHYASGKQNLVWNRCMRCVRENPHGSIFCRRPSLHRRPLSNR